MTDIFKMPVFPAADVFPPMTDDELQELAEDMKANGQREPVVTADIEGIQKIVDGRNRLAACKLLGIEPKVRQLDGEDPLAYVHSADMRRNVTKGQKAMAYAVRFPESEKGGRGKKSSVTEGLTAERLSLARTVIGYASDLTDSVLSGATSLDQAYATARERKDAASSEESRLADLRSRYPELADKVVEGELTLAGTVAEAKERDERAKTHRSNLFSHLGKIVYVADTIGSEANIKNICETLAAHGDEFEAQERYSLEQLLDACELTHHYLPLLISAIKEKPNEDE